RLRIRGRDGRGSAVRRVVVDDHGIDGDVGAGVEGLEAAQDPVLDVVGGDQGLQGFGHRQRIIAAQSLERTHLRVLGARALESGGVQTGARLDLGRRLAEVRQNRLVRQNLILFVGGLVAGIGGFVYHAIAGRVLGPTTYGQVAFLIAVYAVGTGPALILIVVLARYTAMLTARGDPGMRSLMSRTVRLVAIPCLALLLVTTLFARHIAAFEHLGSTIPVLILGFSIA